MPTPNRAGGVGRSQYGPGLKVLYQGPFFTQDPAKTFRQNGRQFIHDVMGYAYDTAQNAAPYHDGYYKAALRRDQALRFASVTGRQWAVTGVLSMRQLAADWPGTRGGLPKWGRPYFNYAGKVERKYHVFRKARSAVYSARKHNEAVLLRNLR